MSYSRGYKKVNGYWKASVHGYGPDGPAPVPGGFLTSMDWYYPLFEAEDRASFGTKVGQLASSANYGTTTGALEGEVGGNAGTVAIHSTGGDLGGFANPWVGSYAFADAGATIACYVKFDAGAWQNGKLHMYLQDPSFNLSVLTLWFTTEVGGTTRGVKAQSNDWQWGYTETSAFQTSISGWHSVVATHSGTTLKLYIDGVFQGQAYGTIANGGAFSRMYAQAPQGTPGVGFQLDEVVMHLGVWTPEQIATYSTGSW